MSSSPIIGDERPVVGVLLLDRDSYPLGMLDEIERFEGLTRPELILRHVEGCTVERLIYSGGDGLQEAMVDAGRDLAAAGADVITGDCGFMLRHQSAVRAGVDVPVALSSLLLLPLLIATIKPNEKVAVITASAISLTPDLLELSGLTGVDRLIVGDMAGQPAFQAAVMDGVAPIDHDAVQREVLDVAERIVARTDDIGAILLECTALPPYAAEIRRRTRLPVHDTVRLVDLMASGARPRPVQRLH